ncbi:crotonobetainyl-CoA:carnitine CoA-transferase CaiB-like acyl-CoA transferase [Microbacterium sp. SORGH_AS428]|uniref:CoA transferase n=1 Tax=Microbacterium sp. SORGH_AS_0428 TaxID=3041788 RepID=UPI00285B1C25|nr:CoA transferase [Microbacterium sp. SORGH_AS_0428]MDR6200709.1 crotonobetainyl-CoA:carnitine CoA-transferase CaiB-like acyl-CoA transferase [Microbacterium sp. SORGH_AS_0428]
MHRDTLQDELRRILGVAGDVRVSGASGLDGALPVSTLATTAMSALASAVDALLRGAGIEPGAEVRVDRALVDAWLGRHIRPVQGSFPSPWDPFSGAFPTADGSWIRTHANAPHHRAALLVALALPDAKCIDELSAAIAVRGAEELESAIVAAGGAAAALRTPAEWMRSVPGSAVAAEPLIARIDTATARAGSTWRPEPDRPLAGLRVLDLTRVIAGPAATQVLAGLGAEVLRIDPDTWDEPAVLPYVMAGKRSARLDATAPAGRRALTDLLAAADVLVHGYRAGAIDHLGLGEGERLRLRPGLIEVGVRAYGWSGPWAGRRGFDSLVQFSTGIADIGRRHADAAAPVSLPVQALDWTTGYLAAAAAVSGLARRQVSGRGSMWRLSLARTARALTTLSGEGAASASDSVLGADSVFGAQRRIETTDGALLLAPPPFRVGEATLRFDHVATRLGGAPPAWL